MRYDPTPHVKAVHSELPIPQPVEWAGYWTFVTATIIIMFLLFIAEKGTLSTWIGFFSWTNPAQVGSATGDQSQTNPQNAAGIQNPGLLGGSNPVGATTANPATGFGLFPAIQGMIANFGSLFTGGGKVVP